MPSGTVNAMADEEGDLARRAVQPAADVRLGESHWPPVAAVLVFLVLNIGMRVWLPTEGAIRAPWVLPAIEVALLVVLLATDPRGVARRMSTLRRLALTLVVLLLAAALWATVFLVYDLITGSGVTKSPSQLLASGALVWLGNNTPSRCCTGWSTAAGRPRVQRGRCPSTSRSRST